jgi:hypothetical protein
MEWECVVQYGMGTCGAVWNGNVWCDMEWECVVWNGMGTCGVEWNCMKLEWVLQVPLHPDYTCS